MCLCVCVCVFVCFFGNVTGDIPTAASLLQETKCDIVQLTFMSAVMMLSGCPSVQNSQLPHCDHKNRHVYLGFSVRLSHSGDCNGGGGNFFRLSKTVKWMSRRN